MDYLVDQTQENCFVDSIFTHSKHTASRVWLLTGIADMTLTAERARTEVRALSDLGLIQWTKTHY